nr:nadph-dependent methylglyoxal reductase gre2 [Quercus suber]
MGTIQANPVGFKVTVFLPSLILGPPHTLGALTPSVSFVYNFFNGSFHELPETYAAGLFPSYIDVRDLATAHVRALTSGGAADKRFLIGAAELTSSLILNTLEGLAEKNIVPELKGRLPKDTGKDRETRLLLPRFNVDEGNEILGLAIRSVEETLGDCVTKIIKLEKNWHGQEARCVIPLPQYAVVTAPALRKEVLLCYVPEVHRVASEWESGRSGNNSPLTLRVVPSLLLATANSQRCMGNLDSMYLTVSRCPSMPHDMTRYRIACACADAKIELGDCACARRTLEEEFSRVRERGFTVMQRGLSRLLVSLVDVEVEEDIDDIKQTEISALLSFFKEQELPNIND